MKPRITSAAIYARISADQDGKGLGVQRQLEDCRVLAEARGWTIGREYVDNDVSAYSGKPRPAYTQMITDLADGERDAVIVYNLDRLHRRPVELEEFVTLCERVGVREVATVTADIDLGNDDGLFMARIFAAFAAKESGRRAARVRRKMIQNAQAGLPHGPSRPFGYEPDKITIRESEADIIRQIADRFIAGESLRSLAQWLNTAEIPTAQGGQWITTTLRGMLTGGRIAGLREHNGRIAGRAVWDPIITTATREQILARMAARKRSGRRAPQRYVLSGMLRCGRCGAVLYSQMRYDTENRTRRYVCKKGPDHSHGTGCGRMTVVAKPVEQLIIDAVLTRLDSPHLAAALTGQSDTDDTLTALSADLATQTARLDELATLYADGAITAREWMTARQPINTRLRSIERTIADATHTGPLRGVIGTGDDLRHRWDELSIDRQHAIIATLLDYATITPGTPGARTLDINRVQPQWRN